MAFKIQQHKEVCQVETLQDTSLGIMKWGRSNAFPQTLKNIIDQSANAKPAIQRTAKFLKGSGFEGENTIVNPYGLTLKKVISICADDYSVFNAFALQLNYNLKGFITGINPMRIADLRFNEFDELNFASKIGYHRDFGRNAKVQKTINTAATRANIKWFHRFNPEVAVDQIESTLGGISNYNGQLSYYSEEGHSSYPVPPLQAAINYVLSDVENSILVRKETATGFINSYILKTKMDSEDPSLIALENAISESQGARGSGKIITFSGLSDEEMSGTTLEEIGAGAGTAKSIIETAKTTYDLDKEVITGAYLIPPALAGMDRNTGFSGEDLEEAYFVFNAITEDGRQAIESEINRVLEYSVFKVRDIKINKLKLDLEDKSNVTSAKKV